jgi:hypothetical protein
MHGLLETPGLTDAGHLEHGLLSIAPNKEALDSLRPSPFKEGLSTDTTFSQIYLDRQYL